MKRFEYRVNVDWTGNDGSGTASGRYGRDNEMSAAHKPTIVGSAPQEFGGDGVNWAPEDLFVAAVSQCHMLTYLYQCSRHGIVVQSYVDEAVGILEVEGPEGGQFRQIELRPHVVISTGDPQLAESLHRAASETCYIGRSVKPEVRVSGSVAVATPVQ